MFFRDCRMGNIRTTSVQHSYNITPEKHYKNNTYII